MKSFREAEGYADDLQSAYDYYKSYGNSAANRFLIAYVRITEIVIATPRAFRARRHGWRQVIIPGHPNFSIFYKELPQYWLFAGIVPTVKDPDAIQARLLIREVRAESND